MMTYLQSKAERAFTTTALVTVWGALVAAQGAMLMLYPLYCTVGHHRGQPPASPPTEPPSG